MDLVNQKPLYEFLRAFATLWHIWFRLVRVRLLQSDFIRIGLPIGKFVDVLWMEGADLGDDSRYVAAGVTSNAGFATFTPSGRDLDLAENMGDLAGIAFFNGDKKAPISW